MLNIVLYQPEIPPNTGNIIRLCHNIGAQLHIIRPMGFMLDDKKLKRSAMDYTEIDKVNFYQNLADFFTNATFNHLYAFTTKADTMYTEYSYQKSDALIFGPETRGLPLEKFAEFPKAKIPMREGSRSINLANSVAIAAFEAWRQLNFSG